MSREKPYRRARLVIVLVLAGLASVLVLFATSEALRQRAPDRGAPRKDDGFVVYKVMPGDTLWAIAQRFFGDPKQFPRLLEANPELRGQAMLTGIELRVPRVPRTAPASTFVDAAFEGF